MVSERGVKMREKLRAARKARNLTSRNVAAFLGVSERAYNHWENANRSMSEENWLKLFDYFDREIPLHELMEKTERQKI